MLEKVVQQLIAKGKLGSFCTAIDSEADVFELKINTVGNIKFPIMPKTAKQLISIAKPGEFWGIMNKNYLITKNSEI